MALQLVKFPIDLIIPSAHSPMFSARVTSRGHYHARRQSRPILLMALSMPVFASLGVPARAVGLTGALAPANWTLINATSGSIDETLSFPGYKCSDPATASGLNEAACLLLFDPSNGVFDVIGSSFGYIGGGSTDNILRTSQWYVTNPGPAKTISFSWLLDGDLADDTASYFVDSVETLLSSSPTSITANVSGVIVPSGSTFAFQVLTTDNIGDPGVLSISNFSASDISTSVPAPMPLFGAGAAFSLSRRLRRRQRMGR